VSAFSGHVRNRVGKSGVAFKLSHRSTRLQVTFNYKYISPVIDNSNYATTYKFIFGIESQISGCPHF
jgi:hypothetical protein